MNTLHMGKWVTIGIVLAAAGQPVHPPVPAGELKLFGVMTEADFEALLAWTPDTSTSTTAAPSEIGSVPTDPSQRTPLTGKHLRADGFTEHPPTTRWALPMDLSLARACLEVLVLDLSMSDSAFIAEVRNRLPLIESGNILDMRMSLWRRSVVRDQTHATLSHFEFPRSAADLALIVARLREEFAKAQQTPPSNLEHRIIRWYKYCIEPLRRMRRGERMPCGWDPDLGAIRLSDFQTKKMFTDYLRRLAKHTSDGLAEVEPSVRLSKQPRLSEPPSIDGAPLPLSAGCTITTTPLPGEPASRAPSS